jgi:hypothetical protein
VGLETVFLGIAAAGTAGSLYSQTQAAGAQRKAGQAQRRQEALSAAIQRRQALKAGRQAQALAIQAGENQGVADSSGVQGGVGSIRSQTTSNLSFLDRQGQLADYAGGMFDKAQRWTNRAQLFAGAADFAMMGYQTAAGDAAAKKAEEEAKTRNSQFNQIMGGIDKRGN